jgi:YD repeat-containing protein
LRGLDFQYASTNGYTRLARIVSSQGRTNSYAYTFRGWLASQTDPKGNVTTLDHDALGRTTRIACGGTNVDLTYDVLDRVTHPAIGVSPLDKRLHCAYCHATLLTWRDI